MKILRNNVNKDGSVTVTVRIEPGERAIISQPDRHHIAEAFKKPYKQPLRFFDPDYHYRLGGQVDDIVAPHVIVEARPVYWCSIEQKWLAAD